MSFSTTEILLTAGLIIVMRLVFFYLERLDEKQKSEPEGERRAIEASRIRARGHLWLVGAILAAPFALLIPISGGPPLPLALTISALLAAFVALCVAQMLRAYRESSRV